MIHVGDALEVLRNMPGESVHCCVTSPPYYGLRDYGVDGQLGLEPVHDCLGWATGQNCGECFTCNMRAVFAEVRRVLRTDGTFWLNMGDSYAGGGGHYPNAPSNVDSKSGRYGRALKKGGLPCVGGLKAKDLAMIPARLALALQQDGWWLRSDVIWAKPKDRKSVV